MDKERVLCAADDIRKWIYIIAHHAGGGHMGAAFSMTDIIATLYFGDVLKYDAHTNGHVFNNVHSFAFSLFEFERYVSFDIHNMGVTCFLTQNYTHFERCQNTLYDC